MPLILIGAVAMSWPLSLFVKIDQFLIGSSADKTEGAKSGSSQQAKRIIFQKKHFEWSKQSLPEKKTIKPIAHSKMVYFRAKMLKDVCVKILFQSETDSGDV